jgi:hypothetical protein
MPPQMPREYEFDAAENEVISGLGGWMGFVGIMNMVFGGIYSLLGLLSLPGGIVQIAIGICMLIMGAWMWAASRAFKDIVRTEGSDITLLMVALRKLRGVFTLQGVLMIVACAFLVLGFLLLMFVLAR